MNATRKKLLFNLLKEYKQSLRQTTYNIGDPVSVDITKVKIKNGNSNNYVSLKSAIDKTGNNFYIKDIEPNEDKLMILYHPSSYNKGDEWYAPESALSAGRGRNLSNIRGIN